MMMLTMFSLNIERTAVWYYVHFTLTVMMVLWWLLSCSFMVTVSQGTHRLCQHARVTAGSTARNYNPLQTYTAWG